MSSTFSAKVHGPPAEPQIGSNLGPGIVGTGVEMYVLLGHL